MLEVMEEKALFLEEFSRLEKEAPDFRRAWFHGVRSAAIERFEELGFPTHDNEDWRFTNVTPITRFAYHPAEASPQSLRNLQLALEKKYSGQPLFEIQEGSIRLVCINGSFAERLSSISSLPAGAIVSSLAAALVEHRDLVEPHLARHAEFEEQAFTALNTAFLRDGAFVYLPKGTVLPQAIHLIFLSVPSREPVVAHPRVLIIAGANSKVSIAESYIGLEPNSYFTNAVTEIVAGPNSNIDHYKIQRENRTAFHVATLQVHQERSSTFSSHLISGGGSLVRNEVRAKLDAEGCTCTLNGLTMASGRQHVDNFTVIDHARPNCTSHELYKCILDGQAHGVFNGKIFVRQDAQKTDAKQTNQTLLLSDDATINTKPQLEIFADDVKCTHGATVGQLDDEAVFYLRSRGIDIDAARNLLTFAFANDIIGRIQIEPVRHRLEEILLTARRLPQAEGSPEAL
jgi:Fe-S cluster assembly protein SufD